MQSAQSMTQYWNWSFLLHILFAHFVFFLVSVLLFSFTCPWCYYFPSTGYGFSFPPWQCDLLVDLLLLEKSVSFLSIIVHCVLIFNIHVLRMLSFALWTFFNSATLTRTILYSVWEEDDLLFWKESFFLQGNLSPFGQSTSQV